MPGKTRIEWATDVWNPVSGCTKVSQGCKHCYAKRVWPRVYGARAFEDVQLHPERLDQPRRWRRPRRIFVNSMSDLFHEAVPFEFVDQVLAVAAACPRHTFQVLTKRPERALSYIRWSGGNTGVSVRSRNVWFGVSIEDQATAKLRVPLLLQLPAAVRFLSVEPMLGPVDLQAYLSGLSWVICGGESGPDARPMRPLWARVLRDQCVAAGVPFFFKQWGEWASAGQVPLEHNIRDVRVPHTCVVGDRVARYGKRIAGRLLDQLEWSQYPQLNEASP